jgi:hypothetical protein
MTLVSPIDLPHNRGHLVSITTKSIDILPVEKRLAEMVPDMTVDMRGKGYATHRCTNRRI